MGRTYHRDGFDLVQVDHPDITERENGRCYQVIADELGFVGTVGTYRQVFEDRSPGKRYVNHRWHSERWWSQLGVEPSRWRSKHFLGPGEAAQHLVWRAQEEANQRARAEAKGKG